MHAHSQVFVQCLHQHTCLIEILQQLRTQLEDIIQEYVNYNAHVIRQTYTSDPTESQSNFEGHEKAWPEYKDSNCLTNLPPYLHTTSRTFDSDQKRESIASLHEEGKTWLHRYLHEDVEQLQMMKQHHVHLRNPDTHIREPLGSSKRKGNPKLCKADFQIIKWLVRRAVILCTNLLQQMGLSTRGRRCQLGSLHGPMNHESINGTHSAMLAALRCNSDVQLPYRFPIITESHCCCHCKSHR